MSQFFVGLDTSGTGFVQTLTPNDGNIVSPTSDNINVLGTGVSTSGVSTAGNIYTTGAGSTLTINETQAQFITNYTSTNIDHAHTPYAAVETDYYISVDCSSGVVTVQLPNAPLSGRLFVVKDRSGTAMSSNITVTTVGGVVDIDGSPSYFLNSDYESANFLFNGTSYEAF